MDEGRHGPSEEGGEKVYRDEDHEGGETLSPRLKSEMVERLH